MKRMFYVKLAILAIILAFGFVMVACETGDEEKEIDPLWQDYSGSSRSISFRNMGGTAFVAFKGELSTANRIGGIPAGAQNHGLKKDAKFFPNKPVAFQMLFLSKADYEKHKKNLKAATEKVLVRTWIYWNGEYGDNSKVYELSDRLGGSHRIQIFGPGLYDVEFRERGTSGPTLGYATSGMMKQYLYVDEGDYDLFPIFQRYNKTRDIMETVIPVETKYGGKEPFSFGFSFEGSVQQTKMLDLSEASGMLSQMQTGVVYVTFENNLGAGAGIYAFKGSVPLTTPAGNQIINSGEPRIFMILMPEINGNYADKVGASFSVRRSAGNPANVVTDTSYGTGASEETSFDLLADKMYTVKVSLDGTRMKAVINIDTPQTFEPSELPEL